MSNPDTSGGILTIDLGALVDNWRLLKSRLNGADCAAAIKADAYGLGAERAVIALAQAGCHDFFIAQLDEGILLRRILNGAGLNGEIHVLGIPLDGAEGRQSLIEHRLTPVLNALADIDTWKTHHRDAPADIHIDTGMLRLGLPPSEVETLKDDPRRSQGLNISYVISHLACAEDRQTAMNGEQLASFTETLTLFPACKASLANSAGIFLGPQYHFDLGRPGAALYGVNPTPGMANPMAQVVRLQGKILQIRDVDTPQSVGYGATHRIIQKGRIATVGVGYADGYLRSLSGRGYGFLGEYRVPLVGRVSMDLITFDVSDVPEQVAHPGALIDLIGANNPVDDVAEAASSIGYEILTSLGGRYHRAYI